MLTILDQRDLPMAEAIYHLQQASYAIERDRIDYPNFPPLSVSVSDIQQEEGIFLGYWADDHLTDRTVLSDGLVLVRFYKQRS